MRYVFVVLLACCFAPRSASAYMDFGADEPHQGGAARPMNHCQLRGSHVSGVVSVDMQNGTRSEVVLVDVDAIVAMAINPAEIVYHVQAPLRFAGGFVAHDLGGPAAHARRAYRSQGNHISLRAGVPVEIGLAPSGNEAKVSVPSPFGGGRVEVLVPCSALAAGAPRARTRVPDPRLTRRGRYIAIAPNAVIVSAPGREGVHLARIFGTGDQKVMFKGSVRPATNGFVQVTLTESVAVTGFLHASFVESVTEMVALPVDGGSYAFARRQLDTRMRTVALPAGLALFADGATRLAWANVSAPMRVGYIPGDSPGARGVIVPSTIDVPVLACRYDGVVGYTACAQERDMPRMGFRACNGSTCTDRLYVAPL